MSLLFPTYITTYQTYAQFPSEVQNYFGIVQILAIQSLITLCKGLLVRKEGYHCVASEE